jgi:hypothetical protein
MTTHSTKHNADRLLQLGDEVSRIAGTLARLATDSAVSTEPFSEEELANISAETVRSVIRARRLRAHYFSEDLFFDPAWDILLDLLASEISQHRVSVSNACVASGVPATTALRWISLLARKKMVVRHADQMDGRRVFLELAPETSLALRQYFAELGSARTI